MATYNFVSVYVCQSDLQFRYVKSIGKKYEISLEIVYEHYVFVTFLWVPLHDERERDFKVPEQLWNST